MVVNFPLFPDDMSFAPDNRNLMNNRQIFINSPDKVEEDPLMRTMSYMDMQNSPSKLPQGQRTTYSSVKRPLGSKMEEVHTYEHSHRRTAIEESKERAKRAAVQPRRPKGYIYPTDRVRPTLHSKIEEPPKINEERYREYQQRKELNVSSKMDLDTMESVDNQKSHVQGNLFSRGTTDYFKKKRESSYD